MIGVSFFCEVCCTLSIHIFGWMDEATEVDMLQRKRIVAVLVDISASFLYISHTQFSIQKISEANFTNRRNERGIEIVVLQCRKFPSGSLCFLIKLYTFSYFLSFKKMLRSRFSM